MALMFHVNVKEMQEQTAINFQEMMARELKNTQKVIVILSKGYKEKADSFSGGVGNEFRYLLSDIDSFPKKYIFVSFESLNKTVLNEIVPDFLKGREIIDLVIDEGNNFKKLYSKILDTGEYYFEEVSDRIEVTPKKVQDFTLKKEHEMKKKVIDLFSHSTTFFDYRFGKAFPGVRGIQRFDDPVVAVKRLAILLSTPLNSEELHDPIWFFRGSSCLDIDRFEVVAEDKCLIGVDECKINKIAVYKGSSYYKSFVYVELKAEEPTGVYEDIDQEYINSRIKERGYAYEEYALYNDTPITRMEYDDGAAVINGDVVDFDGRAKVRIRYLSKYNFVICAKFHPFNSQLGDRLTKKCLDQMLRDEITFEEFVILTERLPRNPEDN